MSDDGKTETLTAAELLRRGAGVASPQKNKKKSSALLAEDGNINSDNIDDEIRRLEAELQADDDDSSSDESSSSDDDSQRQNGEKREQASEGVGMKGPNSVGAAAVWSLSRVKDERITKLPASCLPSNTKRTLKNIDRSKDDDTQQREKKKSRRNNDTSEDAKKSGQHHTMGEGLTRTVQEFLSSYTPRSAERLPFYCRVCAVQYKTEEEFVQHKLLAKHVQAAELERKASFCKLCRKQLTSPAQLKEHLSSKPHKERLQLVRSKQQHQQAQRPVGGRGGFGRPQQSSYDRSFRRPTQRRGATASHNDSGATASSFQRQNANRGPADRRTNSRHKGR